MNRPDFQNYSDFPDNPSIPAELQNELPGKNDADIFTEKLLVIDALSDADKKRLLEKASEFIRVLAEHPATKVTPLPPIVPEMVAVKPLPASAVADVTATEVIETDPVKKPALSTESPLKFWTTMILLGFLFINGTAIVTAILVIGVRTGSLPEMGPVNTLIQLAIEILKTVFAA